MTAAMVDMRLALFRGASAEWLTLEDVLARLDVGEVVDATPAGTTMSVVAGDKERFGWRGSLGRLGRLAAQLDPAAERLDRGGPALVRSAVEDLPEVHHFVFEPTGGAEVDVHLSVIDELPYASWYPDDPERADALLAWVLEHGVSTTLGDDGDPPVVADRAELVAWLRREAALARAVIERLGW